MLTIDTFTSDTSGTFTCDTDFEVQCTVLNLKMLAFDTFAFDTFTTATSQCSH